MKAAMNGVLNLSILDGWWPEGCKHGVNGWQIGEGTDGGEDEDERDGKALSKVLKEEVLPSYGDKKKWESMMRESISMSERLFSSDRMMEDYYAKLYSQQPPTTL